MLTYPEWLPFLPVSEVRSINSTLWNDQRGYGHHLQVKVVGLNVKGNPW